MSLVPQLANRERHSLGLADVEFCALFPNQFLVSKAEVIKEPAARGFVVVVSVLA